MTTSKLIKLVARLTLSMALIVVLLSPLAGMTRLARATGPYTVTVSYDGPDSDLSDGVCWDGVGGCTLRAAIEQASYDGGSTSITFDSSLAGITFYLTDYYGSLIVTGSSITIDGYTGSGNYPPLINGSNLTGTKNVFEIQGNSNTLTSLVIRDGPGNGIRIHDPSASGYGSYNTLDYLMIYGNAQDGILVEGDAGGGGYNNTIAHSLIGAANWAQTTCPGDGNSWEGIEIANGADYTYINSNEIVCNGNSGVWLNGSAGGQIVGTYIYTNKIGTNGTADMGNGLVGIADTQASYTTIYNNIISGNGNDGVWLQGSDNASLTANRIGVDQSGTLALSNDYSGITITDGANGNTIGSPTDDTARNIISGNALCGVDINSGANNNVLDGNYIGLGGTDGMVVIPNGLAGVCFNNVSNNALSTNGATVNQYIAGNIREGVYAVNSSSIIINTATIIGVGGNGSTPAGNQREGIFLDTGTTSSLIYAGKVVYNGLAGITVVGDGSTGNILEPELVGYNVGLAIDLGNDGHTANGSHTPPGPNNWINYPGVNMTVSGGFTGITCPGCTVRFYQTIGDPTANGGGGTFLSEFSADATTGDFAYIFPFGVSAVTMQTCDPSTWDCSELSLSVTNSGTSSSKIYLPLVKR